MFGKPARVDACADPPADPRGVRFSAALTSVVVLGVLVTSSEALFAAQTVVFAAGAFLGLPYAPYHALYRAAERSVLPPRLRAGPARFRAAQPYRFTQGIGFAVALVGTLGYLTGLVPVGQAAAALVLVGAGVNAATGFCAGSELYLRLVSRPINPPSRPSHP
ncbi:MAG TPA: DUF4395 domain-containing protein [Pseudonocardia sp.]|jgi:hypothetical protein